MAHDFRMVLWSCVLLCAGMAPLSALAGPAAQDIKTKTGELKELRARLGAVRAGLDQARGRRDELQEQLRTSEQEIGRLTAALAVLAQQKQHQERQLSAMQSAALRLQQALAGQREHLAKQLRAAYATGRQEQLKLLLQQEQAATLTRVLTYYDYFNKARTTRIDAITVQLQKLRRIQERTATLSASLEQTRLTRQRDLNALQQMRTERKELLAAIDADMRHKGQELARLAENERQLQHLLDDLRQALAEFGPLAGVVKPFAELRGKLPWPVRGTPRSGTQKASAGQRTRSGVLIEARRGSTVRAIAYGRVVFADWLRGFGLLMIIDHGSGYMSLYGHNQGLLKAVGVWVQAGDSIAEVGESGGQARAGLYFEIRRNGQPQNPLAWCRAPRTSG